jgi:hypothetical protein
MICDDRVQAKFVSSCTADSHAAVQLRLELTTFACALMINPHKKLRLTIESEFPQSSIYYLTTQLRNYPTPQLIPNP